MLHSQITPILFTTIKQETYIVENVAYACFSNNGNDDIDDAYVYEMKCNQWKPKHLGCYTILGPKEVKEEPTEEIPLDTENHRYNFYYRRSVLVS